MVPALAMAHDVSSLAMNSRHTLALWQRGAIILSLLLCVSGCHGETLQEEHHIQLHRPAREGWNVLSTPLETNFIGRSLQAVQFMENGSQLILAAARTARKDPLDGFSVYRGGWNIRSSHYWASVSVTATPVWIVILVWVTLAILILLTACLAACCCRRSFGDGVKPISTCSSFLWLTLLAFFTLVCIGGCLILYVTAVASNRSLKSTLQVVEDEAGSASGTLRNVAQQLSSLQVNPFVQKNIDGASLSELQKATDKANSAANVIDSKQRDNSDKIKNALNTIRIVTIVISAVTLLLSIIGFLLLLCGWQNLVFTLVIIGWILLTAVWILTGVGILVSNVIQDTCVAMSDWLAHPAASTTMDDILPCTDLSATNAALTRSRQAVKDIVVYANKRIDDLNRVRGGAPQAKVCDPYGGPPAYLSVDCPPGTVNLSTAYQALNVYVPAFIDADTYQQLGSAKDSVEALIVLGNSLSDLTTCSNVHSAMTRISKDHCPSLRKDLRGQWIGLLILSASASIILLIWLYIALKQRAADAHGLHDPEKGPHKRPFMRPHAREGPAYPPGAPGQAGGPPRPLQQMPGAYVGTGPSNVPVQGGNKSPREAPVSPFRANRVQPSVPPYEQLK